MEGCKETLCSGCSHLKVCKNKDTLLKVQESVDKLTITVDGDQVIFVRDIEWLRPIELRCDNYKANEPIIKRAPFAN